jgi:hypothetical protein
MSSPNFKPVCKACEQKKRNEQKNDDRAYAIIDSRASTRARVLAVQKAFIWINMNWRALVPMMRAMLSPEGLCLSCGHEFVNERDIQIEHREAPRFPGDWAREHARNIGLMCQSCNVTKRDKGNGLWLDEQEAARISNSGTTIPTPPKPINTSPQLSLFDR